jgi:hypothetical protein
MVVGAVDDGDLDIGMRQRLGCVQPAEPAADHHDSVRLTWHGPLLSSGYVVLLSCVLTWPLVLRRKPSAPLGGRAAPPTPGASVKAPTLGALLYT